MAKILDVSEDERWVKIQYGGVKGTKGGGRWSRWKLGMCKLVRVEIRKRMLCGKINLRFFVL